MKNATSAYKNKLSQGHYDFVKSLNIVLKNGATLSITDRDMWSNGLTVETATSSDGSFDIGAVIVGKLTVVLNNIYDTFTSYDFTEARATNVRVGMELDGSVESLKYGEYTLDEAVYNGSIITLTFLDNIAKFDKAYKSNLTFPTTIGMIVRDACNMCNVTMGTTSFSGDDFVIEEKPTDSSLTYRQMLAWCMQITCNYAKADENGRLQIGWYNVSLLDSINTGGSFADFPSNYVHLRKFSNLSVGLDDVVITGVRVTADTPNKTTTPSTPEGEIPDQTEEESNEVTFQAGQDGYVLGISGNKLIKGNAGAQVASMIATKVVGMRFRTFDASALSHPLIEAGDVIVLTDRKGKHYKSVVTNSIFQPGSYHTVQCTAESPARQSADKYDALTQVYQDLRVGITEERTAREEALEALAQRIENSEGVFTTIETSPNGGKIYYLHDKPKLEESMLVWKMTAEAWAVSTDGGKTWNAGMAVDGDTVVRLLAAEGVSADWIDTGTLVVRDLQGNETLYVDTATGTVRIQATEFSLVGKSVEDIAQDKIDNFVDAVLDPQIAQIQAQLDGQLMTWYYDHEPTLDNEPASEWTTEAERRNHEGDLFYWQSMGYAYRFMNDNGTWKWMLVQDTDITKALADAAKAQDTADQKRRVFVVTPTPPYDIGDLWVGNDQSDLMRCVVSKKSGLFVSTDWIKATKYTDDSALVAFVNGTFAETIDQIKGQTDKKAETWYQASDPSLNWTTEQKAEHIGDFWYNTTNSKTYVYNGTAFEETKSDPPQEVFDKIDGKAQIFVAQPAPPYAIGDLWFTGTEIKVCVANRDTGVFSEYDWEKKETYADKDSLTDMLQDGLANIKIGGRNFLRNSKTLIFEDYAFGTPSSDGSGSAGGSSSTVALNSISVPSELRLTSGQTSTLSVTYSPSNTTQKGVTWKSSDTTVATVNSSGTVSYVGGGTTLITATSTYKNVSASCLVTCVASSSGNTSVPCTGISLNKTSLTFSSFNSQTLTATATPSNTTDTITWATSNSSVATVSGGTVTAKANGNATITARCGNYSASCSVTVNVDTTVAVTGVTLDKTSLTLTSAGSVTKLTATVSPSDATNKNVTWTSSNTNVATVDNSGTVTAKANGTTTITANASGKTATCSVTVSIAPSTVAVTGVTLNKTSINFTSIGERTTIMATISPSDATNTYITWTTTDSSIARVYNNGVVESVGNGTATIKATAHNGIYASCTVTVNAELSAMTGVSVTDTTSSTVTLSWNQHANAQGYIIERYTGSSWTQIAKITSASATTYTATGLDASTAYVFRIKAYYGTVYSPYSEVTTVTSSATTTPTILASAKINGTDSNYINTGVSIGSALSSEFELGFSVSSTGQYGQLLIGTSGSGYSYRVRQEQSTLYASLGWANTEMGTLAVGTSYTVSLKDGNYEFNGKTASTYNQEVATVPLRLGCTSMTFQYLKVWNNGGLVLDLVPAKQGSTIGTYDRVTSTFTAQSIMSES